MEKEMSFEEAFRKLEESAEKIKAGDTTLEEAVMYYEKGMEYYRICDGILKNAKQKIEIFEGEV